MNAPKNPLFDINPPASVESEKAFLGSILINPDLLEECLHLLRPDDFYFLRHVHVYAAMLRLYRRDFPIDPELLADELDNAKQLEAVGGRSYIAELANSTPTSVHARFYAELVQTAAIRRGIMRAAEQSKAAAADESLDIAAVKAEAEQRMMDALEYGTADAHAVSLGEALDEQWMEIESVTGGGEVPARIPSRHAEGHGIIRGYLNSAVYTLAARPGVGKSSWMHAEAAHVARYFRDEAARAKREGKPSEHEGKRVRIYSLEMPRRQVVNAIAAIEAGVPYTALDDRLLSVEQLAKLTRATRDLHELPLDIVDDVFTFEEIEADIRKQARRDTLGVAFIDQLSLLETRAVFKGDGAERQRINYIMPRYKRLAMSIKRPLFLLHQVNRDGDDEPKLKNLKDSGKVEESSDCVIFLHRDMDAAADIDPATMQDTTVVIAKNRHGRLGRFTIAFHGAYKAFVSRATPRQMSAPSNQWSDRHENR